MTDNSSLRPPASAESCKKTIHELVKWCDANDWGCVPKRIEANLRAALAKATSHG